MIKRYYFLSMGSLLKRVSTLTIIFVAMCTSLDAQSTEWVKLAPAGGGFSVMMPAKPQEEVQPRDDFTAHLFRVTTNEALYLVAYGDYAPSVRLNIDDELTANRDNFLRGAYAGLTSSKKITVDGRQGIEFTGESDEALFKSRVFIFGIRFHQIAVAVFKGKANSGNVDRFFSSFEFTKAEARPKP